VAIHEAVADLIAVLMALDSRRLRESVLARSQNSLAGENAFNAIAEEFGMARPRDDRRRALRDLKNDETLSTLSGARPHILSTLLSAIFYDTLSFIFATRFETEQRPDVNGVAATPAAAANRALGTAQVIFRRLLLRGIDYLPPGELSFADVGRATLAADRAARPDADATAALLEQRANFATQFVKRLVVADPRDLDGATPQELGVPFTVLPRVDSTKVIGPRRDGVVPVQRELILKVAWNETEEAAGASRHVRVVSTGATVALNWDSGACVALVNSDVGSAEHRRDRDRLLAQLTEDGVLEPDDDAGVELHGPGDAALRGSHRLLHLAGWDE
jgi:hypothetical protein